MTVKNLIVHSVIDVSLAAMLFFAFTTGSVPATTETFSGSEYLASVPTDVAPLSYPYTKTFTISAYYSPLPCQNKYVTGSYESDKKLNGNGVAGADGTPVYPGMIAAPKVYAFGTKLHIPGLGVVAVHDRGGAIVASNGAPGVYDRLDVWMGYGDEGLTRALKWGKRSLEVTVYGSDASITEQLELTGYTQAEATPKCGAPAEVATEVAPPAVVPAPEVVPTIEEAVLDADLKQGDQGEEVKELQRELMTLNFLRREPTGVFDEVTRHALFKFQQSQSLVGEPSSPFAGVLGPKTRGRINEIIATRTFTVAQLVPAAPSVSSPAFAFSNGFEGLLTRELDFGIIDPQVSLLQSILKSQGFFKESFITNYFGHVTRDAVLAFQIAHNIVQSAADVGAGRVGPATLSLLNSLSR